MKRPGGSLKRISEHIFKMKNFWNLTYLKLRLLQSMHDIPPLFKLNGHFVMQNEKIPCLRRAGCKVSLRFCQQFSQFLFQTKISDCEFNWIAWNTMMLRCKFNYAYKYRVLFFLPRHGRVAKTDDFDRGVFS